MQVFASRARLAPGLRVVPRGAHHLQVGMYAGRRALLRRTPAAERAVAALLGQGPLPDDAQTAAVLDQLARGGCLVVDDGSDTAAAAVRTAAVLGGFAAPGLADTAALLRSGGVEVLETSSPRGFSGANVDVALVLSAGELAREALDLLVRERTSHLVVRLVDGAALLGPFVAPGSTACLRCIDAHETLRDPDHVVLTARYVRATSRARPDGEPDVDPALAAVAQAWAVRDVLAHLCGREPSTWSRTIRLGPDPTDHSEQQWLRHPHCGCCWPLDLDDFTPWSPVRARPSGTMEA